MRKSLLVLTLTLLSMNVLHAQELSSPESIVWDPITGRYLVSNAGDGLLRAINTNGESSLYGLEAKASHGLLIQGSRLYACYRATVRAYDLSTEALVDVYSIPGAKFLNGICSDDFGHLYLTDFTTKAIHRLSLDKDGDMKSASTWKRLDRIPNGIAYNSDTDELLVLTWGSDAEIFCIDRASARIKMRESSGYDNLEGILINDGEIFVSAWSPAAIFHYERGLKEGSEELVFDDLEKPTGLLLDAEGSLLHLRTESSSIVGLGKSKTLEDLGVLRMSAFPNPVSVNSLVSYRILEAGAVTISLYDCRGTLVEHLGTTRQEAGQHQFFYERGRHPSGLYFIHIQTDTESQAIGLALTD